MPAPQTEQENCVAHNGSIIPVPGRDIMAQAWYQGGVSVFDFTDSAHPVEIAFFDRGPIDATKLITGGFWSTYWYNGNIYGTEIARGLDIFKLTPSEFLSQNEIDAASAGALDRIQRAAPAADHVVGDIDRRERLPRSARENERHRAGTGDGGEERAGEGRPNPRKSDKGAPAVAEGLLDAAGHLETDAASATGVDANRLRALADTLKGRAEAIH